MLHDTITWDGRDCVFELGVVVLLAAAVVVVVFVGLRSLLLICSFLSIDKDDVDNVNVLELGVLLLAIGLRSLLLLSC